MVCPVQTGELLEITGAAGIGLTVTFTVLPVLVQPLPEAVTVYVPLATVVAPVMPGF